MTNEKNNPVRNHLSKEVFSGLMRTAFIYTDAYFDYDYGPTHPLKVFRLKLAHELIEAYGLLEEPSVELIPTRKADEEDLALFHSRDYLNILKEANGGTLQRSAYPYGLGPGDNPIFKGLYDWSLWVTGATLQAGDLVAKGEKEIAFNIAGGLHHADRSRASGFCYVNDAVVGIMRLLRQGKRVAYVDLDAHHGDGVQRAFYRTDQVLTISLHETGATLFPGTGFEHEIGEGNGKGYSVNLPFPPFTRDDVYGWAFEEIVPPLLHGFRPDIVVTQLGVDSFSSDPLTNLHLSILGFEKVLRRLKELAPRWVALGGGGYEVSNVARAWALAWAVMNGVDISDDLPESYQEKAARFGVYDKKLRTGPLPSPPGGDSGVRAEVERVVGYLKQTVFPIVTR